MVIWGLGVGVRRELVAGASLGEDAGTDLEGLGLVGEVARRFLRWWRSAGPSPRQRWDSMRLHTRQTPFIQGWISLPHLPQRDVFESGMLLSPNRLPRRVILGQIVVWPVIRSRISSNPGEPHYAAACRAMDHNHRRDRSRSPARLPAPVVASASSKATRRPFCVRV